MTRSLPLSVATALILIANAALATDSSGEFGGLFLPWKLVNKTATEFLQKEPQRWRGEIAELPLKFGEFELKTRGIRWDVFGQLTGLEWDADGATLGSTRFSARVSLDELAIDQIIERQIGGHRVRIHVQGRCGPIQLAQDLAEVGGRLTLRWNRLEPRVSIAQGSLAWPSRSWTVTPFTCTGPAGLDKILKDQIAAGLAEPEALRPWLESGLNALLPTLSRTVEAELTKALRWTVDESPTALRALEVRSLPQGTWVSLALSDDAPSAQPPPAERLMGEAPVLWLKSDALTALIKNEWGRGVPEWTTSDLRQNADFLSLLKSRFIQFFVWPDLWNYKTSSPFQLAIQRPDISEWREQEPLRFVGPLRMNAWIRSFRGGRWWNYVWARGDGSGQVTAQLLSGRLSVNARGQASSVKTGFGDDYRRAYPATGWLASSVLNSALKKTSLSVEKSWELPRVELGSAGVWSARELRSEGDWMRVPFALTGSR